MRPLKCNLRTAVPEDVPALRENWRASFGDTDAYLDFFFSRRFAPENTLVAKADGTVVSQLFLLPVDLHTTDGILHADYLFAAATHPEYRGQGIMSSLLKEANVLCSSRRKDAVVLKPGTNELYDFYQKSGFKPAFSRRRMEITREELLRLAESIERADAVSVITDVLSCRDGLMWDEDAVRYALDEHRLFRGAYAASKQAFVSISDGEATFLSHPQYFGECASLLLGLSDLNAFSLVMPPDFPFGTQEYDGMILCLCHKNVQLRDAFISFAME